MTLALPRLLVLTDRSQVPGGRDLASVLAECVEAGLRGVVVREHDLPEDERLALVEELVATPGLLVLSSRLAARTAHGLHLAAHQAAPAEGWWGRSCHQRGDVATAAGQGASWVTLSPWAATSSKPGYGPALPPTAYAGHDVPVLALGGVTPDDVAPARQAGAYGVAVMGAVMRAQQPGDVVEAFLGAVG